MRGHAKGRWFSLFKPIYCDRLGGLLCLESSVTPGHGRQKLASSDNDGKVLDNEEDTVYK